VPNPMRASNQPRVTPACPRKGCTLTMRTKEVNAIAAILESLQQATFNMPLSTCSLQACAKQHARSATFSTQQTWLQPCNIWLVFMSTLALMFIALFGPLNVVAW
jgi:hypothetical protein